MSSRGFAQVFAGLVCFIASGADLVVRADAVFDPPVTIPAQIGLLWVEAADVDGDFDLDLATVSPADGTISLYFNDGSGQFGSPTAISVGSGPTTLAFGDIDCDGDLDLLTNRNPNHLVLYRNNGAGSFTFVSAYSTVAKTSYIALGDLDSDGDLDFVFMRQSSPGLGVFLNDGTGGLAGGADYNLTQGTVGLAVGDVDLDGDVDVVVGWLTGISDFSVFKNNGDGSLAPRVDYSFGADTSGLAMGDLDGDADLDLFLADGGGSPSLKVSLNNGSGIFGTPNELSVLQIPNQDPILVDFDRDNDLDVAVPASSYDRVIVAFNTSSGLLAGAQALIAGDTPEHVAAGDFDFDGDTDLVCANRLTQDLSVYFQSGDPGSPQQSVNIPTIAISELSHVFLDNGPPVDVISDAVDFALNPLLFDSGSFVTAIREGHEIVVRVEAPSGYQFVLDPPTSTGTVTELALVATWMEEGLSGPTPTPPASPGGSHVFENLSGTAPTLLHQRNRVVCDGRKVQVDVAFLAASPCAFSSLEVRFPVTSAPPGLTKVYSRLAQGMFGSQTSGASLTNAAVMSIQPLSQPDSIIIPTVEISGLHHRYFLLNPPSGFVVHDGVTFPAGPGAFTGPGFTAEVGAGDELVARFSAPPGMRFQVNLLPQAAFTDLVVSALWATGSSDLISHFGVAEVEWIGLIGAEPMQTFGTAAVSDAGHIFQIDYIFSATGPFQFESVEFRFPVTHPLPPAVRSYSSVNSSSAPSFLVSARGTSMPDGVAMALVPTGPTPGDANGDGLVNGADLSVLLSQFSQSVPPGTGADFNQDGVVNGADLSVLLSNFGG